MFLGVFALSSACSSQDEPTLGSAEASSFEPGAASAASSTQIAADLEAMPVRFFDCLQIDGVDLLDQPLSARREALERLLPEDSVIPSLTSPTASQAADFLKDARRAGHEGLRAKSRRTTSRRGSVSWTTTTS